MTYQVIIATVCPNCKGENGVFSTYFKHLEDTKKVLKGACKERGLIARIVPEAISGAMLQVKPSVPNLIIDFEVCSDCGTLYGIKAYERDQPVQFQTQPIAKSK